MSTPTNDELKLSMQKVQKALEALELLAQQQLDPHMGLRDGTIQRFEFTVELFWKFLKKLLLYTGIQATTPKDVLKSAFQNNLLNNEKLWLDMLNDRNLTSHTYDEETADLIYRHIKKFYIPEFKQTLQSIKIKYNEMI